jgi:DNA replication protein DnaC
VRSHTVRINDIFEHDFEQSLDESIRVDRELTDQEKITLLEQYHVTESAEEFLTDLFERLRAGEQTTRKGWNTWLYGFYGSGKSHLLTVVGLGRTTGP